MTCPQELCRHSRAIGFAVAWPQLVRYRAEEAFRINQRKGDDAARREMAMKAHWASGRQIANSRGMYERTISFHWDGTPSVIKRNGNLSAA